MKHWCIAILLIAISACTQPDKQNEKTTQKENSYKSPTGNFSIHFPSQPTVSNEVVPTEAGDISVTLTICEVTQNEAYMVSHSDYPDTIIKNSIADSLLLGAMRGAINSIGQTSMKYVKNIKYKNKFPGLSFAAQSSKNYFVIYELYLVKNRLYQIGAISLNQYVSDNAQKDFFGSFTINE